MFIGRSFFDVRPAGFSNLMVAVLMLAFVLATYRNILYIWLIVPIVVFWCNVHGGYVYAFIVLVPFVALNFLTSFSKKRFVSIGLKGVYHTAAAGTAGRRHSCFLGDDYIQSFSSDQPDPYVRSQRQPPCREMANRK
jgi:hypothetical protein